MEDYKYYFNQLLNTKMGRLASPSIGRPLMYHGKVVWINNWKNKLVSLKSSRDFLNEKLSLTYIPTKKQPFLHNELWEKVFDCKFNDHEVEQNIIINNEEYKKYFLKGLEMNISFHDPVFFLPTEFNNEDMEDIVIEVISVEDLYRDHHKWNIGYKLKITMKYIVNSELYQQNNNQSDDVYIVHVNTTMHKEDWNVWCPKENLVISVEKD